MISLCAAALSAIGFALIAQSPAQKPSAPKPVAAVEDQDPTRIVLDVTRVNLLYTVSDKKGRFVTNLDRGDFEIVEGKRPQSIIEFTAETDLPLRLAILIDTSNSVRERFKFEQEAAVEFVNSLMRPRKDKAILVSFDTAAELVSDLTDDPEALARSIRDLRPGGGTSLYDAIYFACRDKLMMDQPRHKFRRAMVVLSDGDDNQSRYTRDQALEMAQKSDVVVYTISTNITRIPTDGDKVLKYLAAETGGLPLFPFRAEDLNQSFENISSELRHQYNVFYRPDPLKADGLYHTIRVSVKNRKDLVVRARKGYYAPKM